MLEDQKEEKEKRLQRLGSLVVREALVGTHKNRVYTL